MSCPCCYESEKVAKLVDGTWRAVYEYSEYESDMELRSSPYYGYGTPNLFLGYVTEGNFLKTVEDAYGQQELYFLMCGDPEYDTFPDGYENFVPLTWEEEYEMYLTSLVEEEPLENTFSIPDQLLSKHKVWERKRKRSKDKKTWVYPRDTCWWGLQFKLHKHKRALRVYTEDDYQLKGATLEESLSMKAIEERLEIIKEHSLSSEGKEELWEELGEYLSDVSDRD